MVHAEAEPRILALHHPLPPLRLRLAITEGHLKLPVAQEARHERGRDHERELASEAGAWTESEVRQVGFVLHAVPSRGIVSLRVGE